MDCYSNKVPSGGKGFIELVNLVSFPVWTSSDEGRLVYNLNDSTLYFGTSSAWTTISNVEWLDRLVPSGGTTGQTLRKSAAGDYDMEWGSYGIPAGTIIYSASLTTPDGFEDCDGASLDRTLYEDLFNSVGLFFSDKINVYSITPNSYLEKLDSILGTHVVHGYFTENAVTFQTSGTLPDPLIADVVYYIRKVDDDYFTLHPTLADATNNTNKISLTNTGTGSHYMYLSSSFKVPDLRGQFIRSYDSGAGVDSGRVFGSFQDDTMEQHSHRVCTPGTSGSTLPSNPELYLIYYGLASDSGRYALCGTSTPPSCGWVGQTGTANENRPKNFALSAYIKW